MVQTLEATIDERGIVYLTESVSLATPRRALVTILEEPPIISPGETALLSEAALAQDWLRAEEEEAWSHLASGQS